MTRYTLFSPTGWEIAGTSDEVSCRGEVLSVGFDHNQELDVDWLQETTVFWDGQITRKAPCGCDLYLDHNGDEWPECQLLFQDADDEDAPMLRIWEAKREAAA